MRDVQGVPYMPRGVGGVTFVPQDGLAKVEAFNKLLQALDQYRVTSWELGMRSVAVWDTDEVRQDLMKDVQEEVNRKLDEIATWAAQDVLDSKDAKRVEKTMERRIKQAAKVMGVKQSYEDLLRAKLIMRDRVAEPKLIKAAEAKLRQGEMTERARALFRNLLVKTPKTEGV